MVSKTNKKVLDMFSIKSMKQLATKNRRFIIDPYDFFKTEDLRSLPLSPKTPKIAKKLKIAKTPKTASAQIINKVPKKLVPINIENLFKKKHKKSEKGLAEEKFQIISDLCTSTRQNLKKIIFKVKKSRNFIRKMYTRCANLASAAYEEKDFEGIPEEFAVFSEKLQVRYSRGGNRHISHFPS